MADAPERLWLWPAEPEDGVNKSVSFPNQPYPSGSTEYIRADVARADAELAVAEAFRRAAEEAAAEGWPDEKRIGVSERDEAAMDCANRIETAILALAPAEALAEVQRIRAERDAALARVVEKAARDARDVFSDHKRAKEAVDYMEQLIYAAIRALAPADALAEVQRLRHERDELRAAVEGLIAVLDRNGEKGPIPDVEMMFCWLAAQNVRAAFRKIAPEGEAT